MTIDTVQAAPDATDPGRGVWGSFVGGRWLAPEGSDLFDVFEPSTGQRLAQVVVADADLVDLAVTDARRAYDDVWRHLTPRERGVLLRQVAAKIRDNAEELGELEAREDGKPRRDALRFDVYSARPGSTTTPGWPTHSTATCSTRGRSRPGSPTSPTAWWRRSCRSTGRRSTSPRSARPRWPPATRSSSSRVSRRR